MQTMTDNPTQALIEALGIETSYTDVFGNPHALSEAARDCLFRAYGITPDQIGRTLDEFRSWPSRYKLEPVYVVTNEEISTHIYCNLPTKNLAEHYTWTLTLEDQTTRTGTYSTAVATQVDSGCEGITKCHLHGLPSDLPWGYHQLTLKNETTGEQSWSRLIVTPPQCYLPENLKQGTKLWGPAVQLYSLRSDSNWGMGDLKDLDEVIAWCKDNGANVIGLNPLHQLFPNNVHHISPYSPSAQTAFNIWYLRPEAISNYPDSKEAQDLVNSAQWQECLQANRETYQVDYPNVLSAKIHVFRVLYDHFCRAHLDQKTQTAQLFHDYVAHAPKTLLDTALFEALQHEFQSKDMHVYGWPKWPEAYQDYHHPIVKQWAETNRREVEFYLYLQWQVERQLTQTKEKAREAGLQIGLYLDLSVGVDMAGAQVWANRHLYALNARVGCPPDALNPKGQDWGLPPVLPQRLRDEGYELFIQMLRENMHYAGALRLDHVMGLYRLFWIPSELDATQGTYVRYPFLDFVKLIALESHRNQCIVIGEDLGTIVPLVRETMQGWNMLSYKVLYFEKDTRDHFTWPDQYTQTALVTAGTHDLPTIRGFWEEKDIQIRADLNLYPSPEMRDEQIREREVDKRALLSQLQQAGLLTSEQAQSADLTTEMTAALHAFLARSNSVLQLVQIEDLISQSEQMNVPGTTTEHANWRQKLKVKTTDWKHQSTFSQNVQEIKNYR